MSGLLWNDEEGCQELVHIPKAPSIVGQRETFLMLDTTNIGNAKLRNRGDKTLQYTCFKESWTVLDSFEQHFCNDYIVGI